MSDRGKTVVQTNTEVTFQSLRITLQDGDELTVVPLLTVTELAKFNVRPLTRLPDNNQEKAV